MTPYVPHPCFAYCALCGSSLELHNQCLCECCGLLGQRADYALKYETQKDPGMHHHRRGRYKPRLKRRSP
eukprot:3841502-Amphidinium_carterae.1